MKTMQGFGDPEGSSQNLDNELYPLVQPSQSLPTTRLISAEMEVRHLTLSHNSQQISYY